MAWLRGLASSVHGRVIVSVVRHICRLTVTASSPGHIAIVIKLDPSRRSGHKFAHAWSIRVRTSPAGRPGGLEDSPACSYPLNFSHRSFLKKRKEKSQRSAGACCRTPNLGSTVHHISVSGSVADTHNSNKIDIKNHTFIAKGEIYYMVWVT
jgi:hypothetical protein